MDSKKSGCLAFLVGFGISKTVDNKKGTLGTEMNEGDLHSGPGGYEGMGYSGGYAADYFNSEEDHEHKVAPISQELQSPKSRLVVWAPE